MESKTNVVILFFSLAVSLASSRTAGADMMSPDYYLERCAAGETEVRCDYRREEIGGPITYDECEQYENNIEYRLLAGTGGTFGGSERFCLQAAAEKSVPDMEEKDAKAAVVEKTAAEKDREFDEKINDRTEEAADISVSEGDAEDIVQAKPGTKVAPQAAVSDGREVAMIGIAVIALATLAFFALYALGKKKSVR